MAKKKRFSWVFLIFVFWSLVFNWSKAVTKTEVEEKLKEIHQSYSQKDYSRSKELLTSLVESFPQDPHFSYFEFMMAKCEYHLKNYQSACDRFEDFIEKFPQSRFIPACHFMLGNINYLWGKEFESAQKFVLAYQGVQDDQMKNLVAKSIEPLLEKKLSEGELEKLAQNNRDNKLAPRIFFWLGKRRLSSRDYPKARESLSYYQDRFPDGADIKEVSLLLEKSSSQPSQVLKVGVLAPITGDYSNYGESMLKGIDLALQYSFIPSKVELVVRDTKGEPIKTSILSSELIDDEKVIAIIGPLESESTVGVGMVAGEAHIPLISPTASQKGIANLSEFTFQLSPSSHTKGKSLAEFLIQKKNLLDFVMFVSEDQDTWEFVRSFEEEAQKLGAKILVTEYFSDKTEDFISLLKKIKTILLERPPYDYVTEEEESFINEIPIQVDGFFIAGGKNQMLKILPLIPFLKINTTVIGTEECTSMGVLNLARDLSQDLIFTSDTLHLEDDQAWMSFLALYRNKYKEEPNLVAALSFDAANLLISILEKGITSPEEIKQSLLGIKNFVGASGTVEFNQFGENRTISIFISQAGIVARLR